MAIGFGAEQKKPARSDDDVDIEIFMAELLKGKSGIDAIRTAGFVDDGSREGAAQATRRAYKLRNQKWVREELRLRHDELMRRTDLPTNETIEHELAAIAFGDYTPAERLKALVQLVRIRSMYGGGNGKAQLTEAELIAKFRAFTLMAGMNSDKPALPAVVEVAPDLTDEELMNAAKSDAADRVRKDRK